MGQRSGVGVICSSDNLVSTNIRQGSTSHQPNFAQIGSDATKDEPFWFINGYDDSQVGSVNNMTDIDLDFMQTPDRSVEGNASQAIPWEQWDTWLAESNAMLPFSSAWDSGLGS
ncbi:hypothetical protein OIDMADRAFT_20113 [Oidiodendron maius Zn]|uniref:Uncharacterized protein n=1 Tax=Oidiodendron maius (strain Zn) TaxID=913774 RepID=A0A0C3D9B9_OIDMZ|nr:hypothetical protein OIDMADRAFT_20113 [Oidiodendron maius Zn]